MLSVTHNRRVPIWVREGFCVMHCILLQCHVIYRSPYFEWKESCNHRIVWVKNFAICICTKNKKYICKWICKASLWMSRYFYQWKKCFIVHLTQNIVLKFSILTNIGASARTFCKLKRKKPWDSMRHLNSRWTTNLSWSYNSKISN